MPKSSPRLALAKNAGFVGSLVGGLSAVSLVSEGFSIGWAEPLRKVLEQYFVITNNIRHFLEPVLVPIAKAIAEALKLDLSLGPHWTDVLLLMLVYLGSRVKAYAASAQYLRALAMLLFALIACIACAFFGSPRYMATWLDAYRSSFVPLLGFLAYDLMYASVGAMLDRRAGISWLADFIRHINFSVPLLAACALANLRLVLTLVQFLNASPYQAFVLAFLADYVLISGYWALRSYQHATNSDNRRLGESVWQRYARSSATNVSINVAIVVISAALFILSNAGLKSAGAEFSQLRK